MNSPVSGKPVRGASLSDHVSIRGTREGFRGYRGNGRCISRIGSQGRGDHNNSSLSKQESSTVEESGDNTVASCGVHKGLADCCIGDSTVRLECGHELPITTSACDNSSSSSKLDNMPVVDGFVENMKVKVLRDTGCSSVVVRRGLVERDKLKRIYKMCVLLDGTVRKFPVARISISSPYYVGECEALCAENPVYDLFWVIYQKQDTSMIQICFGIRKYILIGANE